MKKLLEIPDSKADDYKELAKRKNVSLQELILNLLDFELEMEVKPRFFTREILIRNLVKTNKSLEEQLKINNEILRGLK